MYRKPADIAENQGSDQSVQMGSGQVKKSADQSPDQCYDELKNKFDTSAVSVRRENPTIPATHGSATRQVVSGKLFKKCKSATFQIDGATYTIGKIIF